MIILSNKYGYFKDKNGNRCYPIPFFPVGSIYISVTNVNPTNYFGGTWEQIKDKFLLSAGDTYINGSTGGEATHILTNAEMPTHNHSFTGQAHNHGLNSHIHTYEKVNTPTGKASGNTGSTTLTVDQIPSHNHQLKRSYQGNGFATPYEQPCSSWRIDSNGGTELANVTNTGGGKGHTHTLNEHTHTIGTTSTNTGAASGNTANATQGGTIGNAGSGNAHNNMPPYLVVFVWKKIA